MKTPTLDWIRGSSCLVPAASCVKNRQFTVCLTVPVIIQFDSSKDRRGSKYNITG